MKKIILLIFLLIPTIGNAKIKLCEENKNVIDRPAGNNVIARLLDILLDRNLVRTVTIQEIEELDKNEKF